MSTSTYTRNPEALPGTLGGSLTSSLHSGEWLRDSGGQIRELGHLKYVQRQVSRRESNLFRSLEKKSRGFYAGQDPGAVVQTL